MEDFKIDKSKWSKVRLGELAEEISERADNPAESEYERFVGLDHFVSGDLKIKKWQTTEGLVSAAKIFQKGDILFARRNAYLRRASMVDFDGLCSGDAFVLRENHKKIIPGFLAFILNAEKLWDFANANAAGTMSKRVKWRDLGTYEFLLPPKDQQKKLADLLWAGDEVVESYQNLGEALLIEYKSYCKEYLSNPLAKHNKFKEIEMPSAYQTKYNKAKVPQNWNLFKLSDVLIDVQGGFAEGQRDDNGIAQLRMNNVTRKGTLDFTDVTKIPVRENLKRYTIEKNDVLFCNTNSEDLVGKSVFFDEPPFEMVFSNHFTRLRGNKEILEQKFLYLWLKYHFEIGLFQRRCTKWIGQAAVQSENLLSLKILVPTLKEQTMMIDVTSKFEENIIEIQKQVNQSKLVQAFLLNQIFSN